MPMPRGRQRGRRGGRTVFIVPIDRRTMTVRQGNRPTLKLSVLREEIPDYDLL